MQNLNKPVSQTVRVGKRRRYFFSNTLCMYVIWNRFVQLNNINISNIWWFHLHPESSSIQVSQNLILNLLLWEKEKGLLRGNVSTSRRKLRLLTWKDIPDLVTDFWPRMILPPLNKVKCLKWDHKGRRSKEFTTALSSCPLHFRRVGGPQALCARKDRDLKGETDSF